MNVAIFLITKKTSLMTKSAVFYNIKVAVVQVPAISYCIKANPSIVTMCSRYSEIDPVVWRHREPHVVRVCVVW
jgi:hypothetical protein